MKTVLLVGIWLVVGLVVGLVFGRIARFGGRSGRRLIVIFLAATLTLLAGCAGLNSGLPRAEVPKPGDVLLRYKTVGADVKILVFPGNWSERELFTVDPQTGYQSFSQRPVSVFTIHSPYLHTYVRTRVPLRPEVDYTFFAIYYRSLLGLERGFLEWRIIHVRPRMNAYAQYDEDIMGRVYASKIINLPDVNTSGPSQLRYHLTIPLGQMVKDAMGLPGVVEKAPPSVEKTSPTEPWRPSPTQLYGDPSLGYVANMTDNKFVRGWWTSAKAEGRPLQPPDFELAPGFIREFYLPLGKNWLYVEGYYFTQRGEQSAGWNTFQVEVTSRLYYDGHYGWRVIIYGGHFRY